MASVTIIKSILLIAMVVVTTIAVLLPFCILRAPRIKNSRTDRRNFILSVLNCFGGGVFIATGFLHLLPESKEKMDEALEDLIDEEVEYPFTQFVVCVGFLVVLIIENIVISCKPADQENALEQIAPLCKSDSRLNIHRESTVDLTQHDLLTLSALDDKTVSTTEFTEATHLLKNDNVKNTSEATLHSEATPQLIESGDVKTVTKRSSLHAFTVALALSVHSVFEGLALGLEEETGQAFQVFAAIIIHKTILAFSMGINFVTIQVALKSSLLLTVVFALASPIGGGVGIALAESDDESVAVTVLNAILLSLATGTFFYIAFIEVIGYELSNVEPGYHKDRLLLIIGILLGFALFAGVSFVSDHDHDDHDHDHDHDH